MDAATSSAGVGAKTSGLAPNHRATHRACVPEFERTLSRFGLESAT
jgi:hypothetical protein